MSDTWGYVVAAWLIAMGGYALYALVTVLRGRALSKQVPPERRRWS